MRPRACWLWLIAASACGATSLAISALRLADAGQAELARPFVPAISMDKDRRLATAEFSRHYGGDVRERLGATGLVRCGAATGTGQLTVRNDVITTAAHVLIDQFGKHRIGCVFEPTMAGGGPVPIDFSSIKTGSSMPLEERATRDWAVARLVASVPGIAPYGVGSAGAAPTAVIMCAGGNRAHTAMGTERCSTRRVIGAASDGIREIAIDCNAGPGSSGAALVADNKVVGIYVGYRSSDPGKAQAYSDNHYNFAITVDGPFRRALLSAAR
jgi:hypothetical protein